MDDEVEQMDAEHQENGRIRYRENEDNGEPRNVRQRQPLPRTEPFVQRVDLSMVNVRVYQGASVSRNRQLGPNTQFIPLEELITNGSRHGTVMICFILGISTASSETQISHRSQNGYRGQTNIVRHSRKISIMCVNSSSGQNTAIILQGNGLSPRLFEDTETRDNGKLRPGALVALVNPSSTDRYLANSNTPILSPTRPLLVLNSNFFFPERQIVMAGTSINGFIIHNCQIIVTGFRVLDTPCGGELCDQQSLYHGGVMMNRCACFQMKSRVGIAVVVFDIVVTLPNGNTFTTQFSSKTFNRQYIFTGSLPSGTRASHMEDFEVEDRIFNAANSVTTYINNTAGRFMVIGWTKRGEVQDQAVDQPGNGLPYNAPRAMVQAGTLNYHVTRIDPMTPEDVDLDCMNGLKVDVTTGLRGTGVE